VELGVLQRRRDRGHESAPDAFDIRRHAIVVQDRHLLPNLVGSLAAELDVLLGRVFVRRRSDQRLRGD
jgi:hypothetical protein